jgi:hypothetical protein
MILAQNRYHVPNSSTLALGEMIAKLIDLEFFIPSYSVPYSPFDRDVVRTRATTYRAIFVTILTMEILCYALQALDQPVVFGLLRGSPLHLVFLGVRRMSIQDTAFGLLLHSYQFSAMRIALALQGELSISNLREPPSPQSGNGRVIGLCGQGGHHPYFEVSISALMTAVDGIMQHRFTQNSRQNAVDELQRICQDLREQTYFNFQTKCANDEVPALVPLFPPEGIWYEGRELPLDVWRLISFQFDLVSTEIASGIPIMDVGRGVATHGAMLLGHIVRELGSQRVSFGIGAGTLDQGVLGELRCTDTIEVPAFRLFFEAGCLLTPLAATDFERWYVAVRYLHWLERRDGELRVREIFSQSDVDSRYRALFAEDMAIGIMAVILRDRLGVVRINNTAEVVDLTRFQRDQARADFVTMGTGPSRRPRQIIAESKGSIGRKVRAERRQWAKKQVQQTAISLPLVTDKVGLTFCSSLYYNDQSLSTHCLVDDPDPNDGDHCVDQTNAWRIAYAKALRFAGLDAAARSVARGEPAKSLKIPFYDELEGRDEREKYLIWRRGACRERYSAELLLDLGAYGLMIDDVILNILIHGITEETHDEIFSRLQDRLNDPRFLDETSRSFMTGLGIGCVFYEDLA